MTKRGLKKIRKKAILLIFAIILALIMCGAVSATSYTDIYVSPTGNDSYDGGDSSHPAKTIQHVLEVTKDNGSTVHLVNGVYSGTGNTNITLSKNMTIKGESQTGTIINGTVKNWIFYIPKGINVTIINITLTHGNSSTASGNNGGTIYNDGKLTVKNCGFTNNIANNAAGAIFNSNTGTLIVTGSTFTGNNATNYGGAIYNYGNSTITSSNFTYNTANGTSGRGGAIFNTGGTLAIINSNFMYNTAKGSNGGAIDNSGALTIINCSFTGNAATDAWGRGGAIYNTGKLNVTGSNFTDNNATMFAGAIWNDGGTSTAPVIISKSTFTDNNASSDSGGAIYNTNTRNLIITDSNFTDNNADDYGGAISNFGILTVTGSNFMSNTANYYGGAIYNQATLNITGSNFTGNNALYGGAIENTGTLIIFSSIFTGNNATNYGGAIYNDLVSTLNVTGSIFAGNKGQYGGGAIYSNNGVVNVNFNQIVENAGNSSICLKIGTGTLNADKNWWGDNNDPSGKVSGFTISKWLVLTLIAPSSAQVNSNSIITADLRYDNTGTLHTDGYVSNGILITFATNLGTISSLSSTVNGIAQSTLSSWLTGIANVSAKLNNQTRETSVQIIDTVKPTAKASIKGGLYNINKSITLSMSENGIIYYTKNGNTPTASSTKYTGPIVITSTTTLKFIAIDLAGNPSQVYAEKYIIDKTKPKIISTYPRNNAKASKTKTIVIKFSEKIKKSAKWPKIYVKNAYGKIKITKKWVSGNKLYIKTKKRSSYSSYTVYIPAGAVKDYAGNKLAKKYTLRFKIGK